MHEFLRFYVHCTSNVREAASTNVILVFFFCNSAYIVTQCVIPWMNQFVNESSDPVIWRSIWYHLFRFYWISRFERIVWYEWFSKSFIKTGICCHILAGYCYIYLSMTDLNQPRCQHKNTFSKILFNYQYWPKFLYFRRQKEKENLQIIVHLIRIIFH